MSAVGGKADVQATWPGSPFLATSGLSRHVPMSVPVDEDQLQTEKKNRIRTSKSGILFACANANQVRTPDREESCRYDLSAAYRSWLFCSCFSQRKAGHKVSRKESEEDHTIDGLDAAEQPPIFG